VGTAFCAHAREPEVPVNSGRSAARYLLPALAVR
jgi:hypothetical protein